MKNETRVERLESRLGTGDDARPEFRIIVLRDGEKAPAPVPGECRLIVNVITLREAKTLGELEAEARRLEAELKRRKAAN